jgi:hypothetical protein
MDNENASNAPDSHILDYERLNATEIAKAIYTRPGESVIVRSAFRWMRDGQVIPNAYEMFSMEGVCEDRGWQIIAQFGEHIAIISENNQAD